jgi:hypothetical protein
MAEAAVNLLRYLWALPCSAVGAIALAPLWLCGARVRWRGGIVEAHLQRARLPFEAITLGHVVIAVSARAMRRWRIARARACAAVRALGAAVLSRLPRGRCVAGPARAKRVSRQPVRVGG